jgi:hypothetical protein
MNEQVYEQEWNEPKALSLVRPDLEYHYAFDFCAAEAFSGRGPILCLASNRFYMDELLRRLIYRDVYLVQPGRGITPRVHNTLVPGSTAVHGIHPYKLEAPEVQSNRIIWAEPLKRDTLPLYQLIHQHLTDDGKLFIIVNGLLMPLRKTAQTRHSPDQASGFRRVISLLRQSHFIVEHVYGFHTVSSMGWGYAARLMARMNHEAVADRWLVRMRAAFAAGAWQARLATLNVIVARKGEPL